MKLKRKSLWVAAAITAVFLAVGHRSWICREVVVSVDVTARKQTLCQVFWTEEPNKGFSPRQSELFTALPRGSAVAVSLPIARLEGLRLDFGTSPGCVRASRVAVRGRENHVLDWRDFSDRHDIARFHVDAKGAVDVEASGGDPYAIYSKPLGIGGRLRVNAFAALALAAMAIIFTWILSGMPGLLRTLRLPGEGQLPRAAFLIVVALAIIARIAFAARIPPWFGASVWDDLWFANAADSLSRGLWLGHYDHHTLCKGFFGPAVLAVSAMLRVPFPMAQTLLYCAGCLFFVSVIWRFVRNRAVLFVLLCVLLFNPLSFSVSTFQRVYRNGMAAWQIPVIFGSLFATYWKAARREGGLLPWAVFSGASLWAFMNTREDGIWLAPFAFGCLGLASVRGWKSGAGPGDKAFRTLACLVPLAVVAIGNAALCRVNAHVYGVPLRNDRDGGAYAEAMRDLYLIEPDQEDEARLSSPEHAGHYHNIYYSTLCKAYGASPTLESVQSAIDARIDRWSRFQGYAGRDLKNDHMLFAIREGVADAGIYKSLPESEEFWNAVHRELDAAFSDGRLARRGFSFTAMAAPFRMRFFGSVLREWAVAIGHVAMFRGTGATAIAGERGRMLAPTNMIPVFERLTLCPSNSGSESAVAQSAAISRANRLASAHSACAPWGFAFALCGYAWLSILLLRAKSRRPDTFDGWLLATGLLGSVLVHTACIGYMTATTFSATVYYYLAASYQMALLFVAVVAGICVASFAKGEK